MFSDEIAFFVMMYHVDSVGRSLRKEVNRGREDRGGRRGGGMTTAMTSV